MEFRCRLGTPSGEIIEGVYVAHSEAALRRELEEKGLHVLSLRIRGQKSNGSAKTQRACGTDESLADTAHYNRFFLVCGKYHVARRAYRVWLSGRASAEFRCRAAFARGKCG